MLERIDLSKLYIDMILFFLSLSPHEFVFGLYPKDFISKDQRLFMLIRFHDPLRFYPMCNLVRTLTLLLLNKVPLKLSISSNDHQ